MTTARKDDVTAEDLLTVRDLKVAFTSRKGLARASTVWAVRGVDLDVRPGETVAIVGESGSGKSTTARALMGLAPIHSGEIRFNGWDLQDANRRDLRRARRDMQMVFQDPYASLDPLMPIGESIAEPLIIHGVVARNQVRQRVGELLEQVGLSSHQAGRQPREFSGGQRQRIVIARALALQPKLLILDEPVSALDVSTQNQIINLLRELQAAEQLAYLFISHDLAVVRQISEKLAVMYLGQIVESGRTEDLLTSPAHPYTQALRSAVLDPDPRRRRARGRTVLSGELPSPSNPPTGCSFHPRCPVRMDVCSDVVPPSYDVPHGGSAACLLHDPKLHQIDQKVDQHG